MTIQNLRSRGLETKISLVLSNFSYLRGNGVTGGVLGGRKTIEREKREDARQSAAEKTRVYVRVDGSVVRDSTRGDFC